MKNLVVVAALSWHLEGGLALASAAFAFVSASLGTPALLKPHTTQNLPALMTGLRRLSRNSVMSLSSRELETIMMSRSYRYLGQRRRKHPASLQLISRRSTAFYHTQQRCLFDHGSDLSTRISCLQSMCSSWNMSLSERGSSRAPYGARTCTMLLRDTLTTPRRRCSFGKERQISSLASSSSTGDWGSTPGYRRKPPEEEDIWSKSSVFEFRRLELDVNVTWSRCNELSVSLLLISKQTRPVAASDPTLRTHLCRTTRERSGQPQELAFRYGASRLGTCWIIIPRLGFCMWVF